jgi:hypothetical protein
VTDSANLPRQFQFGGSVSDLAEKYSEKDERLAGTPLRSRLGHVSIQFCSEMRPGANRFFEQLLDAVLKAASVDDAGV